MIERGLPDGKEDPKKIDPYGPFAAVSLLEYGGLKPILPCLGGRSDAARRVVVKRMREEHFNHALPVLVVARFGGEACVVFFCPWRVSAGGGAFGRGPVRATPATPVGGLVRWAGVARRGQKPLGRSPGASFLSPLSLAIQRKGARGRRGRAAPRGRAWASRRSALRPRQDLHEQCRSARADTRGRAGTRSARHRPYREHHVKPRNG